MFGKTLKSKIFFFAALFVGGIGACGQAFLLHHELVNCLPYKVVDYDFYANIAKIGVYFAPLIAVTGGFLFGLKRFWLATIIPVLTCPLVFTVVFKAASLMQTSHVEEVSNADFRYFGAAQQFLSYTTSLVIVGLIIGVICSLLLGWLSKERKLV